MTVTPSISVIIPCCNQGRYLVEAVDSVLAQTRQDFEVLVVDDGSTDPGTLAVLDTFERPKTTVFRTANQGLARARNFLIARAHGRYLCALDADDRLHPEFLERAGAVLDGDPSVTFVSTRLQMFGIEGRTWPDVERCDLPTLLAEDTVITSALVRKHAIESVAGYDAGMPHPGDEDWDLWISVVEAGHKGVILPEVLFYYRRRPDSMCIACTTGQAHLDLVQYIVKKHAGSYRAHLIDVLLAKEAHISDVRRGNVALETELASWLAPTVERRRAELVDLRRKLAAARERRDQRDRAASAPALRTLIAEQQRELAALDAEYRRARAEIDALRASASWRLSAPARFAYELWRMVVSRPRDSRHSSRAGHSG
jgi:glycosyltransferase involved in cell wall biosynthesis